MALLESETLKLGDTTFFVGGLPAYPQGWELSAKVGNILATSPMESSGLGDSDIGNIMVVIKAIMAVPLPQLQMIKNALFEYVEFTNTSAGTPQKLAGAEEMAFNTSGLSSLDVWKVFALAFRVNFSDYWAMLTSHLPGLSDIFQSPPPNYPES